MLRVILGGIGMVVALAAYLQAAGQEPPIPSPQPASSYSALVKRYCATCHNEKARVAGLALRATDVETPSQDAEVWEKVVRKLRTGAMPPAGMPRPDKATYDDLARYLETALDQAAAVRPNPGRPAIHRLNRTEYTNAIRDLLAVDIDGESFLPSDDSGYGFDNNGDVLTVSSMQLDRYMSAARQISRLAIGDPTLRTPPSTYDVPDLLLQEDRMSEDLPFGSRGGVAIRHNFALDGKYFLKIRLQRNVAAQGGHILGLGEQHHLDVRVDGARIKMFTFGGNENIKPEEVEASLQVEFPATAGSHLVGVTFVNEDLVPAPEGMLRPSFVNLVSNRQIQHDGKYDPALASITINGPFEIKGAGQAPSRRRIFICRPDGSEGEEACARRILSTLAPRAYRRPVTDRDVQILLGFYRTGKGKQGFEAGIGAALRRILVDPEFLFRIERDPANLAPDTAYRITDLELASRLSFFLWSSIPDDKLIDLAARGKLRDPATLEQQVRRMLADPRSQALVDNFAGQWLLLRSLRSTLPDPATFPDYDVGLRNAFQEETDLFLQSMLREDHSVLDLLNANYTFVNERLARHYGIPNVYGSRFRRVTLTDENRWGLLGKGSILMLTSYPNRTSPVLRGKWLLENILGTPPPPPPPNVPALTDNADDGKVLTVRQRMEQHRANPACASCHAQMDPLGFALDNFDAIGKWRTAEANKPEGNARLIETLIDASGVLPDASGFRGPAELRKILLTHPDQFAATFTEKLLTYALGRGVEYYDQPALRAIMRDSAPVNYRWSALIFGIVKSAPFQMRISAGQTKTATLP